MNLVSRRVMQSWHEVGVARNLPTAILECLTYILLVKQQCGQSSIGFPGMTTAGSAIQTGLQWIVFGFATVSAQYNQSCKVLRQARYRAASTPLNPLAAKWSNLAELVPEESGLDSLAGVRQSRRVVHLRSRQQ